MNSKKFTQMYQEEQSFIMAAKQQLISEDLFPELPLTQMQEKKLAANLTREAFQQLLNNAGLELNEYISLDEYTIEEVNEYIKIKNLLDSN